jgi:hypothetical protein
VTDAPESPRILGGSATDDEIAAIAAVFAQLQLERAAAVQPLPVKAPSLWMRTLRPLRRPGTTDGSWTDIR